MKRLVIVILVCVLAIAQQGCKDNDECNCINQDIAGSWEATEFMSLESVAYPKNNNYNPVIEFGTDGRCTVSLDVNSCSGSFDVIDGQLEISSLGCTDACCDSDFSQKFVDMLPLVDSFSFEEENLHLNVPEWGYIILRRLSD